MTQRITGKFPAAALLAWSGIAISTALLGIGAFAPLMTTTKFFIFSNTLSLVSGIRQLFEQGHWILGLIILGFSIIFPVLKLLLLVQIWLSDAGARQQLQRRFNLLTATGKWSMLDVFVVALLLVSVKLGALASVTVHYGLYAFAGSVLLAMLVTAYSKRVLTEDGASTSRISA